MKISKEFILGDHTLNSHDPYNAHLSNIPTNLFMHGIVKFLIVLLCCLLLCFCTVLLSEINTIQCHA